MSEQVCPECDAGQGDPRENVFALFFPDRCIAFRNTALAKLLVFAFHIAAVDDTRLGLPGVDNDLSRPWRACLRVAGACVDAHRSSGTASQGHRYAGEQCAESGAFIGVVWRSHDPDDGDNRHSV